MGIEEEKANVPSDEERAAYERLAQEAPARDVVAPEQPTNGGKAPTISEAMEMSSDLTDLQSALAMLFPTKIDLNSVMISRIAPEVFLALWQILSTDEFMRADPAQPIDVSDMRTRNYVRLSIGLDGKGRIDTAELLGAAREERKAERMLGAGGI